MILPGVKRGPVQSLGRINSALAIDEGRAKAAVSDAKFNTVTQVTEAVVEKIVKPEYEREAASQYAKAEATRARAMTEAEVILNNPSGMVRPDEIPDGVDYRMYDETPDGDTIEREYIPTHEVAGAWYKKALLQSQKSALGSMTNGLAIRKMKNEYGKSFTNNYASVLVKAQKRKKAFELADLEASAEVFVEAGDQKKAELLYLGGIKSGIIGPEAGTEKLMAISGNIDAYKISKTIHTSTIAELDGIESYIYRDYTLDAMGNVRVDEDGEPLRNPLSFEQRKTAIMELEARRRALTVSAIKDKDDSSARALNEELIILQDTQIPLDEVDLRSKRFTMKAEDHKALITANKALKADLKGESDQSMLGTLQSDINGLMIPDNTQTVSMRRAGLVDRINKALDAELINSTDAWSMIQRVQTVQAMTFKNPDMDLAVDQIYKRLTKGSKTALGLNTDAQSAVNAANAERALYEASVAAGPEFDPLKWMDTNFAKYQTKNIIKNESKLTKSLAKPFVIRRDNGTIDTAASRNKIAAAIAGDKVTNKVARIALEKIVEYEELERQALELKNKNESSWWSR